jgi:hypothetical protein
MTRHTTRLLVTLLLVACNRSGARSENSFAEIRKLVSGKTAAQVEAILGPPDTRQPALLDSERWIWWNYTFLDGNDFAPERRGQVVHLEIGFDPPQDGENRDKPPYAEWRISDLLGVTYAIPRGTERSREEP